MSRVCSICVHPKRLEIDKALAQGKTMSGIGREYGVAEQSLSYHRDKHLSRQLMQAVKKKSAMEGINILGDIEDLIERTKRILDTAENKKQYGLALAAIREARGSYELLCKIAVVMHETKKEELEAERSEAEYQTKQEFNDWVAEEIEVLNAPEKSMYLKLLTKLVSRNTDTIIPTTPTDKQCITIVRDLINVNYEFGDLDNSSLLDVNNKDDKIYNSEGKTQLRRTKPPLSKDKDALRTDNQDIITPKHIEPEELTFTKFSDGPFNTMKK